jgi:hypothetical protein
VANVKAKYRILDEDTYNFDETGFQISVGGSVKVVTASEIWINPIGWQPGDREWITLIAAVNAVGWLAPPFFIFKGKNHNQSWYHNYPKEWRIAVSDNCQDCANMGHLERTLAAYMNNMPSIKYTQA